MRLALRILRPHSLTLTLTLSLSHCLSHLSHLSHLFLISLISLSLSLSLLSVSRLSVSLLSLLSQEDPSKEPHIKESSPLPPQRAPCFFLPRCPPLSHSGALAFAPPLGLKSLSFLLFHIRAPNPVSGPESTVKETSSYLKSISLCFLLLPFALLTF